MQFIRRRLNFNLSCLNIEALFLLYYPLQLLQNHTDVVYRFGITHNTFNKVGTFLTPFHNFFLCCYPGLNLCLTWIQYLLCNTWKNASNYFRNNTTSWWFYHDCTLPWKMRLSFRDYPLRIDGVFTIQYQKGPSLNHEVATSFYMNMFLVNYHYK